MKKGKFSEEQIVRKLKEYDTGKKIGDICREHGIGDATFYNWKNKYSGMEQNQLKRSINVKDADQAQRGIFEMDSNYLLILLSILSSKNHIL